MNTTNTDHQRNRGGAPPPQKEETKMYITFMENGEHRYLGPYITITPDGARPLRSATYKVQTENGTFSRVSVPYYHMIVQFPVLAK